MKKIIEKVYSRQDWKEYYSDIAQTVKKKSKDHSTKVGAVIVNKYNEPISFGFNGFPAGADESALSWERPLKYEQIIHAEMSALIFARRDITGCVVFCTHGPCPNCLKHLLAAGVREIYYNDPSIIRERGSDLQKQAIASLIKSTDALVRNVITDKEYTKELIKIKEK